VHALPALRARWTNKVYWKPLQFSDFPSGRDYKPPSLCVLRDLFDAVFKRLKGRLRRRICKGRRGDFESLNPNACKRNWNPGIRGNTASIMVPVGVRTLLR